MGNLKGLNELYVGRNLRVRENANNGTRNGYVYLILEVLSYEQSGTCQFLLKNIASGNEYQASFSHLDFEIFGLSQVDRDILAPKIVADLETAQTTATENVIDPASLNSTDLRVLASSLKIPNYAKHTKEELLKIVQAELAIAKPTSTVKEGAETSEDETEEDMVRTYSIIVKEFEEGASVEITGSVSPVEADIIESAMGTLLKTFNHVTQLKTAARELLDEKA